MTQSQVSTISDEQHSYCVQQGDCLSSIAFKAGFHPNAIWNHPDNLDLRKKRRNPSALLPGDLIHIPVLETKTEPVTTDACHRFVRNSVPAKLRIVLRDENDEPRSGLRYVATLDGTSVQGTTDADGAIEFPIAPDALHGELRVGDMGDEIYTLQLGYVDPIDTPSGVRHRLVNLGYECGVSESGDDPLTQQALISFQADHDLDSSGLLDDATRKKLQEAYGS
jgi:hypothetical protein